LKIDGTYISLLLPRTSYSVRETDISIEVEARVGGRKVRSAVLDKEKFPWLKALYRKRQMDENWRYIGDGDKAKKWFD